MLFCPGWYYGNEPNRGICVKKLAILLIVMLFTTVGISLTSLAEVFEATRFWTEQGAFIHEHKEAPERFSITVIPTTTISYVWYLLSLSEDEATVKDLSELFVTVHGIDAKGVTISFVNNSLRTRYLNLEKDLLIRMKGDEHTRFSYYFDHIIRVSPGESFQIIPGDETRLFVKFDDVRGPALPEYHLWLNYAGSTVAFEHILEPRNFRTNPSLELFHREFHKVRRLLSSLLHEDFLKHANSN